MHFLNCLLRIFAKISHSYNNLNQIWKEIYKGLTLQSDITCT